MYKLLLFDIDETLFDFKKTERKAFEETFYPISSIFRDEKYFELYKKINKKMWTMLDEGRLSQEKLKYERIRLFLEESGIERDYVETTLEFMDRLSKGAYLLEGAEEVIKKLNEKHKMIVVTNGLKEVQRRRIEASAIGRYFDKIVVSDEVGVLKPERGIFEYAVEDYEHIKKSEMLMIGDSIASDIKGGRDFGIATCWFNRSGLANNSDIREDYKIENLKELLELEGIKN